MQVSWTLLAVQLALRGDRSSPFDLAGPGRLRSLQRSRGARGESGDRPGPLGCVQHRTSPQIQISGPSQFSAKYQCKKLK